MFRRIKRILPLCFAIFCCVACLTTACSAEQEEHTHVYSEPVVIVEAGCTNYGVITRKCTGCGYEKVEKTEKLAHNMKIVQYERATCENAGFRLFECEICGKCRYETEPKSEHDFVTDQVDADCFNRGYKVRKCQNCSFESFEYTTENPKGHNFVLAEKYRDGCGNPLRELFRCTSCGATKSNPTKEIAEHAFETAQTVVATCESDGYIKKKCVYCDTEKREILGAVGHKEGIRTIEATCTQAGVLMRVCLRDGCDKEFGRETIGVLPHEYYSARLMRYVYSKNGVSLFDDYACTSETSSALCYEIDEGKHFSCDKCGLEVKSVAHETTVKDTATCVSKGDKTVYCNRCGEVFQREISPAKGHKRDENLSPCFENNDLTDEYFAKTGILIPVCFKCPDCGVYVKSEPHVPDIADEQVTCANAQSCTLCGKRLKEGEHKAPSFTCCSTKNDGFYYCVVCEKKMGELTDHVLVLDRTEEATCVTNAVEHYSCACGYAITQTIENTKTGHLPPLGAYECRVDEEATSIYREETGGSERIAYRCAKCDAFIVARDHEYNCAVEEVTCIKSRFCKICGEVDVEAKLHTDPEFKCVDSFGDGQYRCVVCGLTMGRVEPHSYTHETSRTPATCSENVKIYARCVCGAANPDGEYYEEPNTKLGHKLAPIIKQSATDCEKGHYVRLTQTKCQNAGCSLDFSQLVDENASAYCFDIQNYITANGYYDQYLFNEQTQVASDKKVCTLFSCCDSTNYTFIPSEHEFGDVPFTAEDYTDDKGNTYKFVPSTCVTHGCALFKCEKCNAFKYDSNMPYDAGRHAGEQLSGGKYCDKCAPEDYEKNLSWNLKVLRQDGTEALKHGVPLSASYSIEFLRDKIVSVYENGEIAYYKFTAQYVAELTTMCYYNDAASARTENAAGLVNWSDYVLNKDTVNEITVYLPGENE